MTDRSLAVLAIDDDPGDAALLLRHVDDIAKLDVEMLVALDPGDGLALLAGRSFDVVLLDYNLGTENGMSVLESIRRSGHEDLPVVFLTGHGDEEVAAAAMRAGAADYMPKSALSPGGLERMLVNAVERRDLQLLVKEHQRNLEATNQNLAWRNREIEGFYHSISHELKTPLSGIQGFLDVLLEEVAGPVSGEQREFLEMAVESCHQMKRCIEDLLDATRLETGKLTLERRGAPLDHMVDHALRSLASIAAERRIGLVQEIAADLPDAHADPARVGQVLRNLVGNALKFTEPGGEVRVEVRAKPDDSGFLCVAVRDTGRGIPEQHLERVFERLHQTRDADHATQGGMGLGLSICKELVELHGGAISVESEVGRGTCFTFSLPVYSSAPAVESV